MLIYRLIRRLRTTASLLPRPGPGNNRHYSDNEIDIIAYFATNLHSSVREACLILNIPPSTFCKILRRNKRNPYCIHGLQALNPFDQLRRVGFCNWILIQNAMNPLFLWNILSKDECFFRERRTTVVMIDIGISNTNPFFVSEVRHQ